MWTFWRRRTGATPDEPPAPGPETGGSGKDDEGEISDEELLDQVAAGITRRSLGVPAILFLESSKPLSFVGSQFLVFMEPFVKTFFTGEKYDRFASLMEDRENFELLIRKIEARESGRGKRNRGEEKAEGHDR